VAKAPAAAAPSAPAPAASAADTTAHGSRKKVFEAPPVYIDGKLSGFMLYGDIPAQLPRVARPGSSTLQFYRLTDYLTALGVPLDKVKAVHVKGKRRTWGSFTGDELRARKNEVLFHFSREVGGKPTTDWDTKGLKNALRIDYFKAIAVYVEKPEPTLPEQRCFLDKDGECSNAIPYVDAEPGKGTRIYVDGRLHTIVKRRLVNDKLILEGKDTPSPRYSLARYLESAGIDLASVKGTELVMSDDRFVGRAIGDQWRSHAASLAFTLPAHGHGKVVVEIPKELLSTTGNEKPRSVLLHAIHVYRKAAPLAGRDLYTLAEDEDGTENTTGVSSGTGQGESEESF
jgi:hypothetical protein